MSSLRIHLRTYRQPKAEYYLVVYLVPPIHRHLQTFHSEGLACAVRLSPALLTLGPFLLLVATSITIALLLLDISLRVHVTESGGLHARRPHTDLAPHVLYRTVRNAFHLSVTRA